MKGSGSLAAVSLIGAKGNVSIDTIAPMLLPITNSDAPFAILCLC